MDKHSTFALLALAAASVGFAQQPAQTGQVPAAPAQGAEGFFRPADDPALTRFPTTGEMQAAAAQAAAVEALLAERKARETAERELERAHAEAVQAQAEAPARRPMIVSPLDGTAPIVSALDGTLPLISPIGR